MAKVKKANTHKSSPKEKQKLLLEAKSEVEVKSEEFHDFNIFEYNLFWILHLLIIMFTISYLGGSVEYCLERFFEIVNPGNWF